MRAHAAAATGKAASAAREVLGTYEATLARLATATGSAAAAEAKRRAVRAVTRCVCVCLLRVCVCVCVCGYFVLVCAVHACARA